MKTIVAMCFGCFALWEAHTIFKITVAYLFLNRRRRQIFKFLFFFFHSCWISLGKKNSWSSRANRAKKETGLAKSFELFIGAAAAGWIRENFQSGNEKTKKKKNKKTSVWNQSNQLWSIVFKYGQKVFLLFNWIIHINSIMRITSFTLFLVVIIGRGGPAVQQVEKKKKRDPRFFFSFVSPCLEDRKFTARFSFLHPL